MPRRIVRWPVVLCALGCSTPPGASADGGPFDGGDGGAGPSLAALEVVTAADSGVGASLVPRFSPTVFDYYVRCSEGPNSWVVSMSAANGETSFLREPKSTTPSPHQSVALKVAENQAIVAVAADPAGRAATEYWIRCLPHDFPGMEMVRHADAGTPTPGYYLVGTSQSIPDASGYAIILDARGVPVWYVSSGLAGQGIGYVDSLEPGSVEFLRSLQNLPIVIDHLDPRTTTYAAPSRGTLDTHELRVLPDGHFLVLSNPIVRHVDLTGVRVDLPDGGVQSLGPGSSLYACRILEFEPTTGEVVWTWDASDHFDPARDAPVSPADEVEGNLVADPYHCNSIDVDPANQNLLVSSRNLDSVFYVERPSGRVVWKMGGSCFTKDSSTCVPVKDPFYRQHDARLRPGWSAACGSGQVSVFDDHSSRRGSARGLVLDVFTGARLDAGTAPDCGVEGTSMPRAVVAWQYAIAGSSGNMGSFRISADGSRVIGWGWRADGNAPVFTETDDEHGDLLDFYYRDGRVSYRAIKVPIGTFDLEVLRRTAGLGF